jgi:hypothetical protein
MNGMVWVRDRGGAGAGQTADVSRAGGHRLPFGSSPGGAADRGVDRPDPRSPAGAATQASTPRAASNQPDSRTTSAAFRSCSSRCMTPAARLPPGSTGRTTPGPRRRGRPSSTRPRAVPVSCSTCRPGSARSSPTRRSRCGSPRVHARPTLQCRPGCAVPRGTGWTAGRHQPAGRQDSAAGVEGHRAQRPAHLSRVRLRAASKHSVAGAFGRLGNYLGWRGEHDVRFCYYLLARCGLTRNPPRTVHRAAPVTVTLDLPHLADCFEHVF